MDKDVINMLIDIEVDYNECFEFIKEALNVELFNYQKMILKALCEGLEIRTARGIGRSLVVDCLSRYLAYKKMGDLLLIKTKRGIETKEQYIKHIKNNLDRNNYFVEPDIIFPYTCALKVGVFDENFIKQMKEIMDEKDFDREFLCVNKNYF